MINWKIFNNPKDKDKRNVSIASALYANIHQDWISFHDRHDLRDFEDNMHVQHAACEDGFPAFANPLLSPVSVDKSDLLYIWDFCRYLHERSERYDETWDMFIHDDVYPRQFGSQLCGEHFFCWIIKEHLTSFVPLKALDLSAFSCSLWLRERTLISKRVRAIVFILTT